MKDLNNWKSALKDSEYFETDIEHIVDKQSICIAFKKDWAKYRLGKGMYYYTIKLYINTITNEVTGVSFSDAVREGGDDTVIKAMVNQIERDSKLSKIFEI
jgi:hypothetical protein